MLGFRGGRQALVGSGAGGTLVPWEAIAAPTAESRTTALNNCPAYSSRSVEPSSTSPPTTAYVADGGGIPSTGAWQKPPAGLSDFFKPLRAIWLKRIFQHGLHKQLLAHTQLPKLGKPCPWKEEDLRPLLSSLLTFLRRHDQSPSAEVDQGQPFRLDVCEAIARATSDPDTALFTSLKEGVRTGYHAVVPASGIFRLRSPTEAEPPPLLLCDGNWKSADDDMATAKKLVEAEVADGFAHRFHGTIEGTSYCNNSR